MTLMLQETDPSGSGNHYFLIDHSISSNHTNKIRTEASLLGGDANSRTLDKCSPTHTYTHTHMVCSREDEMLDRRGKSREHLIKVDSPGAGLTSACCLNTQW